MDPWLRFIALGLLVAAAAISVTYRLRADRLGGRLEHPAVAGRRRLLLLPARLLLLALLVASFVDPAWMHWAHLHLPDAVRWAGVAGAAVGIALTWWMFHHLGLNVTPVADPRAGATLVTTGPYRFIRHPLYLFGSLCLIGIGVAVDNVLMIVVPIGAFILMAIRVPREEALLAEKFGDAYRAYAARTGRFLPRRVR